MWILVGKRFYSTDPPIPSAPGAGDSLFWSLPAPRMASAQLLTAPCLRLCYSFSLHLSVPSRGFSSGVCKLTLQIFLPSVYLKEPRSCRSVAGLGDGSSKSSPASSCGITHNDFRTGTPLPFLPVQTPG